MQKIIPFLWFDHQAEEAVQLYTSLLADSKIGKVVRYTDESAEAAGQAKGSVMTIDFELNGQQFVALNGGPVFHFTEAISFLINCDNQEEVDRLWDKLSEGGDPKAQQCGWLKDKYGVSWQVVPTILNELLNDPDPERAKRAMTAMLKMKKIDIAGLTEAAD